MRLKILINYFVNKELQIINVSITFTLGYSDY